MAWRRGQAYSDDLRGRVLATRGSARVVAARFEVSVSYVLRARQRRDRHDELHARPQVSRTPRRLDELHDAIAAQIRTHDDATLDELRAWLHETHGVAASIGLMWNTVARLGLTLKKSRSGRRNRHVRTSLPHEPPGGRCSPA